MNYHVTSLCKDVIVQDNDKVKLIKKIHKPNEKYEFNDNFKYINYLPKDPGSKNKGFRLALIYYNIF